MICCCCLNCLQYCYSVWSARRGAVWSSSVYTVCRSRSMCLITFITGLISSLATNNRVRQLSTHSMSSITVLMKVLVSDLFLVLVASHLYAVSNRHLANEIAWSRVSKMFPVLLVVTTQRLTFPSWEWNVKAVVNTASEKEPALDRCLSVNTGRTQYSLILSYILTVCGSTMYQFIERTVVRGDWDSLRMILCD